MFANKEQLCQSFWQSVKEQKFKAKKIEEGGDTASFCFDARSLCIPGRLTSSEEQKETALSLILSGIEIICRLQQTCTDACREPAVVMYIRTGLQYTATVFDLLLASSYSLDTGLIMINKGWYVMFFACMVWCVADVSSVSPSSEQTEGLRRENQCFMSYVKDSIPDSQFLRLRKLCSDDSDFNSKCDEMSNFFSERGYPDNILSKALTRVQNVNR